MEENENKDESAVSKSDNLSTTPVLSCALCGCSTPAVRCDRCNSQIFCLSCDDMYHRHPKRKLHLRKAVDSIWSSTRSPKLRHRTELPGDPSKIPIPPPRSKKRERHTLSGRMFLKQGHELGSFGYSKVFDPQHLSSMKSNFAAQKFPVQKVETYENESSVHAKNIGDFSKQDDIYENDNVINQTHSNDVDRNPWNTSRPNISSPIQVSIPSNSPDIVTNGQSFLHPQKQQSRSNADLATGPHPIGPYNYPYPIMHQAPQSPYAHTAAHISYGPCLSSSWSNLMSPHPSPFFHPMPWGSAAPMPMPPVFGAPPPNGLRKHSHGDLPAFPDPNFSYPYHPNMFYPNGSGMDPSLMQQPFSSTSKSKKSDHASPKMNEKMTDIISPSNGNETQEANNKDGGNSVSAHDKRETEDSKPSIPQTSWSCVHCTFINPAGIYICQVCCKTSYNEEIPKSDVEDEIQTQRNRDNSPPMELVNMDAEANSHFTEYPKELKVT